MNLVNWFILEWGLRVRKLGLRWFDIGNLPGFQNLAGFFYSTMDLEYV